jgi:hypothetical protein
MFSKNLQIKRDAHRLKDEKDTDLRERQKKVWKQIRFEVIQEGETEINGL